LLNWKTEEQDGYDPLTEGYDGFAFTTTAGELRQMIEDIQNQYNKEKFLSIEFEEDEEDARPFEGSPSARRQAQAGVDSFTEAYIEAAIWSSMDESDESGGRPIDENYGPEDLSSEALSAMSDDCRRFQADNEADLDEYESVVATGPEWTPSEQAGHDFWLTRNGHGAGFWSRDVGEVGDRLSKAAEQFGEQYLYVGDDGKLYVM